MGIRIVERGKGLVPIVVDPSATAPERHAAQALRRWIREATGADLVCVTRKALRPGESAILVGQGAAATKFARGVDWKTLGEEKTLLQSRAGVLLLAGGRPRGTLYAVHRFLEAHLGIRWWTPWAVDVPKRGALTLADLELRETPAFEARNPFWYHAFDPDWAVRNGSNAQDAHIDAARGGAIDYKGFVHTFYPLVPPERHFKEHPEWFSMNAKGERYVERGQLCTTNPALRAHIVAQVRQWLRSTPEARIVSISQNDWYGACLCPDCKAIDDAEGTPAGTMLALVNHVAERLEKEFPKVAFDTLAYQYTRKAPRTLEPRPSVVVRLCSIECNFREPLEAKANGSFGDDLRAWSKRSNRLYIWDYVTNFGHYLLPHPNWFHLGANVRFFHRNGVRGLFEQGAYQSHGAEMAEMRAWVLAKLLWNPYLDDRALIREFLEGYYGKASAPYIQQYLALLHARSAGVDLRCFAGPVQPHLDLDVLTDADRLWGAAAAAATDPAKRWRIDQGRNAVRYAVLVNWARLRKVAKEKAAPWPWGSVDTLAGEFLRACTAPGPAGWKPVTHVNEGGETPAAFVERLAGLSPDNAPLPADFRAVRGAIGVRGVAATLFRSGDLCERRADSAVPSGKAVRMRTGHTEWAVQFPVANLPEEVREGIWEIHAIVRYEGPFRPGRPVLSAGAYDTAQRVDLARADVSARGDGARWHPVKIGEAKLGTDAYVWFAPATDSGATAIWIDRLILVPRP